MTNATTYGDIGTRTAAYAAAEMLAHAEPVSILAKFGKTVPLPKNKTDTIKFRRPVPFSAVTVPLAEGVTPSPGAMSYEDVTVQLLQWGDWYPITDKVQDMSEDPVLKDISMLCGEQAQKTLEQIIYAKIKAGTNAGFSNGTERAHVNTAISINDQRKAVRYLRNMKARPITRILSGSPDYNTTPVEGGYIAVCHTDLQADIRALPGFIPVAEYGSQKALCPEEFGSVEDVRYITSPELSAWTDTGGLDGDAVVSTTGTNADVYPVIFFGQDAYGLVPLKGAGAIVPMVLNPGTPRHGDPLGQVGSVAWKAWMQATILNQTWIYRFEVAATAL